VIFIVCLLSIHYIKQAMKYGMILSIGLGSILIAIALIGGYNQYLVTKALEEKAAAPQGVVTPGGVIERLQEAVRTNSTVDLGEYMVEGVRDMVARHITSLSSEEREQALKELEQVRSQVERTVPENNNISISEPVFVELEKRESGWLLVAL
jgi:hypothetical protein